MKHLKLILHFYSRSKIASVILFIVLTISTFFASIAVGQYRYLTYAQEVFMKSGLDNALYFMPNGFGMESLTWSLQDYLENVSTFQNKMHDFSAVRTVINSPLSFNGVQLWDDELQNSFPIEITQGKQLDHTSNSNPNLEQGVDAILCGSEYRDVKIGETIEMQIGNEPNQILKIHVVGKTNKQIFTPSFSSSSNKMKASQILNFNSAVICRSSPELISYLNQYVAPQTMPNFFIDINLSADENNKKELVSYLKKQGSFATYDEIIANSKQEQTYMMKKQLPMPLFFLSVSTISLVSISVLFVYKNMRRNSIYYLCGCSRCRSFFYMACGIGCISVLAGIINIIIVLNMDFLMETRLFDTGYFYRFDYMSMWLIVFYILGTLIISVGIPYLIYRKMSPIELYRRIQR